jgi:hypothetical protein
LKINGHDLEEKIATAFPFFRGHKDRGSGCLTAHLIQMVLKDMPTAIPIEVIHSFEKLLGEAIQ